MKKYNRQELQELADKNVFPFNEGVDEMFATEDGEFHTKHDLALFHAKQNGLGKPIVIERDAVADAIEENEPKTYSEMTKAELKAEIQERVEAGRTIDASAAKTNGDFIKLLEADDNAGEAGVGGETKKSYDDMTKAELKAEIEERVETGRTIDASAAKTNADFIKLLEADDAAKATESEAGE